jgi:hypothetical protein
MSRRIRLIILTGVSIFVLALLVSAIVVPQLRLLHTLQALIYVFILFYTRRGSAWAFGAAVFIASAWNCLNLFATHLFQAGAGLFWDFVRTGNVSRPETLMVFVGSLGHLLLIIGCMAGFLRQRPGRRQWLQFLGGGLLVIAYMGLIILIAAPR